MTNLGNLNIKRLSDKDIDKLRYYFENDNEVFNQEQIKLFLSEKQNLAFIVILNNEIIGLLYGYILTRLDSDKQQFHIYSVGILSDYQNNGYGSKLVQYAIEYAKKANCLKTFIITEKDNLSACRVYEKAGGKLSEKDNYRVYTIKH